VQKTCISKSDALGSNSGAAEYKILLGCVSRDDW